MRNRQHGATLLEVILATAIMGWFFSYVGSQLKIYALNRQIDATANNIINLVISSKTFLSTYHLKTETLDSNGKDYIPNPLLLPSTLESQHFPPSLNWMKKTGCTPPGSLPDNLEINYLSCNYNSDVSDMKFIGFHIDFNKYNNVMYPKIKRYIKNAGFRYVSESNQDFGYFMKLLTRISNIKRDGEFPINYDQFIVSKYSKCGNHFCIKPNTGIPLSTLLGPDITVLNNYIDSVTSETDYSGFDISVLHQNKPIETYLKRDGSVSIEEDKSLCWNSVTQNKKTCLRAVSNELKTQKFLLAESDFAAGANKKKTPIQVSQHVFIGNKPVYIPYLRCPSHERLMMKNKITAFSSSFSTGSENATDFSNNSAINSQGTKGADGKHAMMSGLSLEWDAEETAKRWKIEGALAFDASFSFFHDAKSVLRNPKSMSFIAIQWCEEI